MRINLDLLNAQQQLTGVQRDLAQARYNYLIAIAAPARGGRHPDAPPTSAQVASLLPLSVISRRGVLQGTPAAVSKQCGHDTSYTYSGASCWRGVTIGAAGEALHRRRSAPASD